MEDFSMDAFIQESIMRELSKKAKEGINRARLVDSRYNNFKVFFNESINALLCVHRHNHQNKGRLIFQPTDEKARMIEFKFIQNARFTTKSLEILTDECNKLLDNTTKEEINIVVQADANINSFQDLAKTAIELYALIHFTLFDTPGRFIFSPDESDKDIIEFDIEYKRINKLP